MCSKEILANDVKRLCQEVRRYVSGQVEIWRRLPWLALQAEGRQGSSYECSFAYRQGVWGVRHSMSSINFSVYVDLQTGDLVDVMAFHQDKTLTPASDELVFPLAVQVMQLDAASHRLTFERRIQQMQPKTYNEKEMDAWREQIIAHYKLKPLYDETCVRDMNDLYIGD